jgi:threonine dehydratase
VTGPPALSAIYQARRRLSGRIRRTPLAPVPWLSRIANGDVYVKLESLQITGSFKLRGALNAALTLQESSSGRLRLVTASAGNHGRALAHVADLLDIDVTVFTPREAPRTKLDAIRQHDVDLQAVGSDYEDAERQAKARARESGATYLSPYSHPRILEGAATIGIEIIEDLPECDAILAPVGGGGLIGGLASAAKALNPTIETIGVEAQASTAFGTSLAAGHISEIVVGPTIADGLAGNMDPETITFDIVRQVVDRVVAVPEEALRAGIRSLAAEEHLIAEGAGIAALAAVESGVVDLRGRRAAVVVSGSNIDLTRLSEILGGG